MTILLDPAGAEALGPRQTPNLAGLAALLPILAGCSPAPYQNVLGSFFPSWMLCVLAGIGATVIVHKLLAAIRLADVLPMPLLTYLAMTAAFTFWAWLTWLA